MALRMSDLYDALGEARREVARLRPLERECAALRDANGTLRRELARALSGRATSGGCGRRYAGWRTRRRVSPIRCASGGGARRPTPR